MATRLTAHPQGGYSGTRCEYKKDIRAGLRYALCLHVHVVMLAHPPKLNVFFYFFICRFKWPPAT